MNEKPSKASRFALEILREHPQISFAHAVSAATYAGIMELSAKDYQAAQRYLGIPLSATQEINGQGPVIVPKDHIDTAELIRKLEAIRAQYAETAALREALIEIRTVVRAALLELA